MSKFQQYIAESHNTNSTKRIAFVGNTSFSLYNFRLGVMKSFIKLGHQVFAIAPEDKYSGLFEAENITFEKLAIDGKGMSMLTDFLLLYKLTRLYQKQSFDFVFHYTIKPIIYGSLACRLSGIKSIAVTTGLGYAFDRDNFLSKFVVLLYKISLNKVNEVWFLNSDDKDVFVQKRIVEQNRTYILRSEGVNTNIFYPQKKEETKGRFVFLFLSRLVREKGIEEFALAAKKLKVMYPDIECQILGKTEIRNPNNISIDKVTQWESEGFIHYFSDSIDVRPYIANSDCVVLPSYYREGIPRCLMEAMSMKRPIITTNNVGCKELIEDEINGKVCRPKDVESLTNKMEEMYVLSNEIRNQMGERGRSKILSQFDEKGIIDIYISKLNLYTS